MKQLCVLFFVLVYSVSFSQDRDTIISLHKDSCYLRIPLQRADRWTVVRPVLTCTANQLVSDSVWLYDRWGREVYAGSGFEDLRKVMSGLSPKDGDFTWRFRIEMEDKNRQKTIFEYNSPLRIVY